MVSFEDGMRQGGAAALRQAGRFFMKEDPVFQTLAGISRRLGELDIPYCIAGGMALVAHGYARTTVDVDILVSAQGLHELHRQLDGRGYVPPFARSRNLRDTATGVRMKFLVAGQYPGDGKPKPVAFPDPASAGVVIDGIRYLGLTTLVELKLASGISAAYRLKDLADVQELIRTLRLPQEFAGQLDSSVRAKFVELWTAVQASPPED